MAEPICRHLDKIKDVQPSSQGCDECLKAGDSWVNLRMCMTCGNVGCCNSSKNKHAMNHFMATDHPIIQSYEPGQDWWFCWVEQVGFEIVDGPSFAHP